METRTSTDPTRVDPVDVVALGHVLSHAAVVGLPMPGFAMAADAQRERRIRLDFDNLADLTEWALYAEATINGTSGPGNLIEDHVCEAEVLELKLRLTAQTVRAVEPEPARPALSLVEPLADPDAEPEGDFSLSSGSAFGSDFGCCVPARQDAVTEGGQ